MEGLVGLIEQYHEWIEQESKQNEKEFTIYQVGRLNPRNELMKQTTELLESSISENFNVL